MQQRWNLPALEKGTFSAGFDLPDPFHGFDGRLYQVTVIANGNISSFFEINRRVLNRSFEEGKLISCKDAHNCHFLARRLPKRFCPTHFARISFHPEC